MGVLDGKAALVTGAASGIGLATVRAFLDEGARVVGIDDQEQPLPHCAEFVAVECDVQRRAQVDEAVRTGVEKFGALQVVANCAGIVREAPFLDITEEEWARTMGVNLHGTFNVCQSAVPAVRRSGGGSIINVGSIASVVAEENHAAYCAAKGAVLMMTKTIALEHARDGIRANCLCPGMIDTPMASRYYDAAGGEEQYPPDIAEWQPLGLGRPEQIASVVLFLASGASSFITGTAIMADGGFTAM